MIIIFFEIVTCIYGVAFKFAMSVNSIESDRITDVNIAIQHLNELGMYF